MALGGTGWRGGGHRNSGLLRILEGRWKAAAARSLMGGPVGSPFLTGSV